jgi:glycosyltransferase involved in cell wall biosynthesis
LRILHVAYIYPPKLGVADGITNVVYNVTKELVRRGHQVSVYTSDMLDLHGKASLDSSSLVINGVDVHYMRSLLRYKTFIITPALFPLLSKSMTEFDVIHVHDCRSFQGISAYLFAKAKGVPYVFQPHGSYLSLLSGSPIDEVARLLLDKLISQKIVENASKIIAISQMEANQYRSMGVSEEKIVTVPNGIDLSEYVDLPPEGSFKKEFDIEEGEKIVLYLGRIHESKGLDLLAKAFSFITKDLDNVRLVVVGPDDGYLASFSKTISDLGLEERVLLPGLVSKEDKFAALVDSDVFVTPRFSGFPVTFLEACLAGCPIVTTSNELNWIHNNVGYVAKNSPVSIGNAVLKILQDKGLREELRNNCRRAVKSFDISKIASQLENTYKSIAS